jgi:hypothetical protein
MGSERFSHLATAAIGKTRNRVCFPWFTMAELGRMTGPVLVTVETPSPQPLIQSTAKYKHQ